jgi:hypothetical protein
VAGSIGTLPGIVFGLGVNLSLGSSEGDKSASQLAKVGWFTPDTTDTNLPLPMSPFAVMKGLAHSFTSLRSVVVHCRREGALRERPDGLGFAATHRRRLGAAQKLHHRVRISKLRFC